MTVITANNQPTLKFPAQNSVIPQSNSTRRQKTNKAWLHFVAGGLVPLSNEITGNKT